jgi:hypothetical protein
MRPGTFVVGLMMLFVLGWANEGVMAKSKKKKRSSANKTKIISKNQFEEALKKLAADERVPIASSTLVEKGRGKDYYSIENLYDQDPQTFWAEGVKGWGKNEWVVFHIPDGSTHVEIIPGASKDQFINFNRPKELYLDIYHVKLKRADGGYKPKFTWKGRTVFKFADQPKVVRKKLSIKLPEIASADRTMYVGVLLVRKVYPGQFDDTSISHLKTSIVWGE